MNVLGKRKLARVTSIVRRWLALEHMPVRRAEVSHGGQRFWCRAYIGGLEIPVYLYVNYKSGEVYVPEHDANAIEWKWLEGILAGREEREARQKRWAEVMDSVRHGGLTQVMEIMNTKRLRRVGTFDGGTSIRQPWDNPDRREERINGREAAQ